jgi:CubicO group peptidase (beta-lactamase class C family)
MKKSIAGLSVLFSLMSFDLMTAGSLPAARSQAGPKEPARAATAKKIDEYLTSVTPFGFSGAILVAKGGEILINKGYGLAIRDKGISNTSETVFSVGSITKQFTAAGILKLEMMGKLSAEDTLGKFFSDVPPAKQKISLHQLMTHTSGIGGDVGGDYEIAERDDTVKKILAQPLRSEPGTEFFYSNAGYSLLAAVVEKASGRKYEEFLSEYLFKPAGLFNTGYRLPHWEDKVIAHWYAGDTDNGVPLDKPYPYWNLLGNGGILSTTDDMFKWNRALKDNEVLSAEAKKTLWTPELNDYACGWDVIKSPHGTLIQHDGGSTLGNSADCRWFVEPDIFVMLFSNQSPDGSALIFKLKDKIEKIVFGGDVTVPPRLEPGDPRELAKFAGEYKFPSGSKFEVKTGAGGLFISAEGQDAIGLLMGADMDNPKYAELSGRTGAIVEKTVQGDYQALHQAFGGRVPLERIQSRQKRMWQEMQDMFGPYKSFRVLGTIPFESDATTFVEFEFEKGTETIQYIWGPRGLLGIRVPAIPLQCKFLPRTATEFIGYDIGLARLAEVQFNPGENGTVISLTMNGRTAGRT